MKSSGTPSLSALQRALAPAAQFIHSHPRGFSAAILALLAGTGVTAFGIAPMAPDAADLPKRLVVQTVTPEALAPQLEALADAELQLNRSDITRPSDTLDSLMQRLGVADAAAVQWLRLDPIGRKLVEGRPGKMITASLSGSGRLASLVARFATDDDGQGQARFSRLTIERDAQGRWQSHLEQAPLESTQRLASGTIRSSLFAATDESNIPDAVATQIAELFSTDIDFRRELRKGDTFSVVYEHLTADGEPITWNQGSGRVLAAEFINDGHPHQAVWFGEGKGGYFDLNGESKRRSFLASPMEFSRVTSGFSMRFHPIQKIWKAHLGVDYGAPMGTPIRSVGDGTVEFAGQQNGYGNVVQVHHAGDRTTLYAHMSRIDVRKGQHVSQGDRLGAVGMTGWATGPHLHFEFKVGGLQKDPLEIAKSSETIKLDPSQRARFTALAQAAKIQLTVANDTRGQQTARVE